MFRRLLSPHECQCYHHVPNGGLSTIHWLFLVEGRTYAFRAGGQLATPRKRSTFAMRIQHCCNRSNKRAMECTYPTYMWRPAAFGSAQDSRKSRAPDGFMFTYWHMIPRNSAVNTIQSSLQASSICDVPTPRISILTKASSWGLISQSNYFRSR